MARLARLTVAGQPHHVLQRGHNGQAIVADDQDRERLLALLAEHAQAHRLALHAWVLLDNQFQILATPADTLGIAGTLQAVGRRYVRYFNDRHGRTGTLWDGRFRSTVLQAERYLLPVMVSMDLEPVRTHRVTDARDHVASSHAHYIGQRVDRTITPHPAYWALGNTPFAREAAYAERVRAGLPAALQGEIDAAVQRGWALGDDAFLSELQSQTPRRLRPATPGRPRKPI